MRLLCNSALIILASVCAATLVSAQTVNQTNALAARLEAQKVITATDGKESFASAEQIKPGDVVNYKATYSNVSKKPLRDVAAILPVPTGLNFMPGTQLPPEASIDGKTYLPTPLTKRVVQADGKTAEVHRPYSDYRFLRWNIGDIDAGAASVVSARMKVVQFTPAAVSTTALYSPVK